MKLNLYKYHIADHKLVGYNNQDSVPMLVANNIFDARQHLTGDEFIMELRRHRDILAQDPETAVEAAVRYRNVSYSMGGTSLFNRNPEVERMIATNPDAIARYCSWVIGQVEPRYHEQILKSSIHRLAEYLTTFKQRLDERYPEFVERAYERISEDPESAFDFATGSGRRIPGLEPGVFRFSPNELEWRNIVTEPEYMALPQTPGAGNNMDNITSGNMHRYGEYDSPWNLYVSSLIDVKDRIAAVEKYGFRGREFNLGKSK